MILYTYTMTFYLWYYDLFVPLIYFCLRQDKRNTVGNYGVDSNFDVSYLLSLIIQVTQRYILLSTIRNTECDLLENIYSILTHIHPFLEIQFKKYKYFYSEGHHQRDSIQQNIQRSTLSKTSKVQILLSLYISTSANMAQDFTPLYRRILGNISRHLATVIFTFLMSKRIIKNEKKCFDKFSSGNSSKQTHTQKNPKKMKKQQRILQMIMGSQKFLEMRVQVN